jgi:hypothetical protein
MRGDLQEKDLQLVQAAEELAAERRHVQELQRQVLDQVSQCRAGRAGHLCALGRGFAVGQGLYASQGMCAELGACAGMGRVAATCALLGTWELRKVAGRNFAGLWGADDEIGQGVLATQAWTGCIAA